MINRLDGLAQLSEYGLIRLNACILEVDIISAWVLNGLALIVNDLVNRLGGP